MPMMPPQQIWKPSFLAARRVASLSAVVWVVQRLGKSDGAASKLQWTRWSPAAFSFARSSSETSPSEAQRPIPGTALRISRRASQTFSTSSSERHLPEVTMPILSAPLAAASFAAFTHASVPTQPYVSHPVFQCADCAHHLQFSEQRPERAFMMEQKSKRFSTHRSVTSCALSRSSSRRSGLNRANNSSLAMISMKCSTCSTRLKFLLSAPRSCYRCGSRKGRARRMRSRSP